MLNQINETANFLKNKGITNPKIGIILGTGLGNLATKITVDIEIDYSNIPNFPLSTVESHSGKLIYGKIEGKQVLALQGRFHYYEGYNFQEVTFPIRIMKQLGVEFLLLSNAAGMLNLNWQKGDLMILDDHINMLPDNPLRGKNHNELGTRWPDMSQPYSSFLNNKLLEIATNENINLRKGVYVSVMGPNLETRAEYRFLRLIGADAVGMSTVPEVIVAKHAGIPCCAISVLTDECDPDNLQEANINDIIETAGKAEIKLTMLYTELIKKL